MQKIWIGLTFHLHSLSVGALAASKGSHWVWLLQHPGTSSLMFKPAAETLPGCFHQSRAQQSPWYVHGGLGTLPCLGLWLWLPLVLQALELSCFHSYQCVRKVTQSSRIQRFVLQMECAVFLQECTSEVITLSVNSGELSTSNDRAIMCWPLPKIFQQLFQLFCHPKKTLFQFQLAGF